MEVNIIEVNALVNGDYTKYYPMYIVSKDEGFQYMLVHRRFIYNDSKIL